MEKNLTKFLLEYNINEISELPTKIFYNLKKLDNYFLKVIYLKT